MQSSRKSDYSVQKLKASAIFTSLQSLIDEIKLSLNVTPHSVGYIEPGHGLKGKQRWLTNDQDLTAMYAVYEKKLEVLLWCQCVYENMKGKQPAKKRSREDDSAEPTSTSKKSMIMQKIEVVEEIVKKLQEKTWLLIECGAIQCMGTHDTY